MVCIEGQGGEGREKREVVKKREDRNGKRVGKVSGLKSFPIGVNLGQRVDHAATVVATAERDALT